jgi:glycosyltransferase involved in cell wall biosynthesis
MHIQLLTAYFPPDTGSAAHLFHGLGQALRARGHRVSVVTGFPSYHALGDLARYRGRLWLVEDVDGLAVARARVPVVSVNTRVGRGLWQFACAASLGGAGLRLPRPDVALVYSPPLPLGLAALVWRRLRRVPCVVNVQDLFPQSAIDLGLLRQPRLIRLFEALERQVYQQADAITVHSPGNAAHVAAHGGRPERTWVIPNSIDAGQLQPGPRDNVLRQALGLNGHFVASFAGIMGHSQDLDVILEAARRLQAQPQIRFLLVGEGVEKARLVQKAIDLGLDNVIWLPMQPRERYPLVLHASDVCLVTLHAQVATPTVPSKILSAMAAARPVVAALNLAGDAPKLIAEAQAGYSVPPGNAEALASAVQQLAQQPELGRQLGQNGRRYAEAHLTAGAVAEQYERLFQRVTGQFRPGAQPRTAIAERYP